MNKKYIVNFLIFFYTIYLIMEVINDEKENEEESTTEKQYIELAEDCKNRIIEKNKEVLKWKKE